MKKKKDKVKRSQWFFLYFFVDLLITLFFVTVSFITVARGGVTDIQIKGISIYVSATCILTTLAFVLFGVYDMLTSNFGLIEAIKIGLIVLCIHVTGVFCLIFVPNDYLPRMSLFTWGLSVICMIFVIPSVRLIVRTFSLLKNYVTKKNRIKTIVIGAGDAAKTVIDESRRNKESKNKIVLLLDDDINKIDSTYGNIPVRGPISNVKMYVEKYEIEEVIIAISALTEDRLHEILEYLNECPVRVKRMPIFTEMASPNAKNVISVDLNELLCRKPVKLDNSEINNMLNGNVVLVTGAGGSIGSELVRQIFNTHPKTLVLFDIYENSTYDIQMELVRKMREENITDVELVTLIGSTYNEVRVEQVIKKYRPNYIYHAAAYKHVPLMEDSPAEAIRTNVIGTYNVARLADKYGVKKMVLVSTDKAVRPTNVMGATKRFAETIIQYFADKSKCTSYAAVRFGNVLGSNGSVVPLFKKQIEAGGPVTITHKDIIRYFMTIPEAVSLILQCSLFATGGEIFILDMGKPVKIWDLAEKLIRQAGYIPMKDIQIVETGLRPGEKLFEELLINIEHQTKTSNEKIYIEEKESIYPIEDEIKEISKVFKMEETNDIKDLLGKIITTYKKEEK